MEYFKCFVSICYVYHLRLFRFSFFVFLFHFAALHVFHGYVQASQRTDLYMDGAATQDFAAYTARPDNIIYLGLASSQ